MRESRVEKGEIAVRSLVVVLGTLVLLSPAACTMNRHYVIARAIANGAEPIGAKCAIEADTNHDPLCIAYTVGKAVAR